MLDISFQSWINIFARHAVRHALYVYNVMLPKKDLKIIICFRYTGPWNDFLTKGVEVTNKFLLAKLYQYLGNFE